MILIGPLMMNLWVHLTLLFVYIIYIIGRNTYKYFYPLYFLVSRHQIGESFLFYALRCINMHKQHPFFREHAIVNYIETSVLKKL
jgi:hypothetical protein